MIEVVKEFKHRLLDVFPIIKTSQFGPLMLKVTNLVLGSILDNFKTGNKDD